MPKLISVLIGSLILLTSCGLLGHHDATSTAGVVLKPTPPAAPITFPTPLPEALGCTMVTSSTSILADGVNQPMVALFVYPTGGASTMTLNGTNVPITGVKGERVRVDETLSQTTTYTATVSNGEKTASCQRTVTVTPQTGPSCTVQASENSLTVRVSADVAQANLNVVVTDDVANDFSLSFDGQTLSQDVAFTVSEDELDVQGQAFPLTNRGAGVLLTVTTTDAAGNAGNGCSFLLP